MTENLGETGCGGCEQLTKLIEDAEKIFQILLPQALDGRGRPRVQIILELESQQRAYDGLAMWGTEISKRRSCCDRRDLILLHGVGGQSQVYWCRGCGTLTGDLSTVLGSLFPARTCTPSGLLDGR